ncbi:MAG: DUF6148 family protein [Terriglobales bacterium]
MTGYTLEQAQAQLDLWLKADAAVAAGQSYTIQGPSGARSLSRADAQVITGKIQFWRGEVERLSRSQTTSGVRVARGCAGVSENRQGDVEADRPGPGHRAATNESEPGTVLTANS